MEIKKDIEWRGRGRENAHRNTERVGKSGGANQNITTAGQHKTKAKEGGVIVWSVLEYGFLRTVIRERKKKNPRRFIAGCREL